MIGMIVVLSTGGRIRCQTALRRVRISPISKVSIIMKPVRRSTTSSTSSRALGGKIERLTARA